MICLIIQLQKITQDYLSVKQHDVPSKNDFVIAVRPEFIKIHDKGQFSGEVYSSMPTGMETTIRINIGEYIMTGVVFGNITFEIGSAIKFDIDTNHIILYATKTQKLICKGKVIITAEN